MLLVRKAQIAGTFYPEDKEELESSLKQMLAYHQDLVIENIYGIIVPHAGYMYSGKIAAKAYQQISNQIFDNIIVISPSHYDYFEGCSVFNGIYETPIGQIEPNSSFIEALSAKSEIISVSNLGHQNEHALEIQLPFLQLINPNFKLIPIVMGQQKIETAEKLANALISVLNDPKYSNQKNLLVCSSDLSHFKNLAQANILDNVMIDDIEAFDIKKLNENILAEKTEACGFGPIMAGMLTCKRLGATKSKVLAYCTSADVSKDHNKVVGYLSAAFYK